MLDRERQALEEGWERLNEKFLAEFQGVQFTPDWLDSKRDEVFEAADGIASLIKLDRGRSKEYINQLVSKFINERSAALRGLQLIAWLLMYKSLEDMLKRTTNFKIPYTFFQCGDPLKMISWVYIDLEGRFVRMGAEEEQWLEETVWDFYKDMVKGQDEEFFRRLKRLAGHMVVKWRNKRRAQILCRLLERLFFGGGMSGGVSEPVEPELNPEECSPEEYDGWLVRTNRYDQTDWKPDARVKAWFKKKAEITEDITHESWTREGNGLRARARRFMLKLHPDKIKDLSEQEKERLRGVFALYSATYTYYNWLFEDSSTLGKLMDVLDALHTRIVELER
jgi:hypothetical protein